MAETDCRQNEGAEGDRPPPAGVKRPLLPLVLALMAGLTAAAWGLEIPEFWLSAGAAVLLGLLALSLVCRGSAKAPGAEQGREG